MSIEPAPVLPAPPNRLIGREAICAHVADLLLAEHHRLVTLTGPGGVGKTHLAISLVDDLASQFPDGAWFVALEQLSEPELVLPAIARAIGLHEVPGQPWVELLVDVLRDHRVLIVLDNLEQVTGVAPELARLLSGCRHLRILGTSRAALRIRAEREVPVSPLEIPDRHGNHSASDIAESAAVALFVERARSVRPTFTLTEATASVVAEICRRLDGLPLAIELAASTINVLSPQALLERLGNRLQLLANGAVDLPPRQRSLRSAIAWSYDLLDGSERQLFERLSVLAADFGLDAAGALVDGHGDSPDLVSRLSTLVDKSLLSRVDTPDGDARFRMLSTIQEFAGERLAASGDLATIQERLLTWALDLAERSLPELTGPDQARWLAILEQEHDNLRGALIIGEARCPQQGLRIASALWRFWATRGYLSEGYAWLERYTTARDAGEGRYRARADISRANLALDLGAYDAAMQGYQSALLEFERLGDRWGVADGLNGKGLVHLYRGEHAEAREAHERSLAIRREIGNRHGEANSLTNLANAVKELGEVELAADLHLQALQIRRSRGDWGAVGFSLVNLGDISRRLERADDAAGYFQQSLETFRELNDSLGQGYALLGLGHAAMFSGDHRRAVEHYADALAIRMRLGDRRGMIEGIEGIAAVAAMDGHQDAVRLFAAAEVLRAQVNAPLPKADHAHLAPLLSRLESTLGASIVQQQRANGATLSMMSAAEDALQVARRLASSAPRKGALSDREEEVLRLVASGLTNGEVADRLFLSRRTVDAHMRRIYDKLDLSSRLEAIRYAADHGLV